MMLILTPLFYGRNIKLGSILIIPKKEINEFLKIFGKILGLDEWSRLLFLLFSAFLSFFGFFPLSLLLLF
jgi:hypothetical protein